LGTAACFIAQVRIEGCGIGVDVDTGPEGATQAQVMGASEALSKKVESTEVRALRYLVHLA